MSSRVHEIARGPKGGRLYVGSADAELDLPTTPITVHVIAAVETKPARTHPKTRYVRVPLDDAEWDFARAPDEVQKLKLVAKGIAQTFRNGGAVLITCHRGWNRSALVAAFALLELGLTPKAIVKLIRAKRGPRALSNRSFVRAINAVWRERDRNRVHQTTVESHQIQAGRDLKSAQRDPGSAAGGTVDGWASKHARRREIETCRAQSADGPSPGDGREEVSPGDGLDLSFDRPEAADVVQGDDARKGLRCVS